MDASKKKQMLKRKAVKSRKRKISKLHVDVCIMESRVPLGPGKFHVVVLVLNTFLVAAFNATGNANFSIGELDRSIKG